MIPIIGKKPIKGFDGMYRCVICGTLMVEERFHCPKCIGPANTRLKKNLHRLFLYLIIMIAVFLSLSYWL